MVRMGVQWIAGNTPPFVSNINPTWKVNQSYADYGNIEGVCITFPKRFRWRAWRKIVFQ